MFIQNDNLTIRNATAQDAALLCKWWNDGKVMAHAGFPNGIGITADEICRSLENDRDDTHRRLMIAVDSQIVGEMNYRNKGNKTAEVGIKICDFSKQNMGHGSKLLKMLINSLFNDYGYEKIILDTNLNNKRAQHVYEKLGFIQTKIDIDSWHNQLGELQSQVYYELSKKGWADKNADY